MMNLEVESNQLQPSYRHIFFFEPNSMRRVWSDEGIPLEIICTTSNILICSFFLLFCFYNPWAFKIQHTTQKPQTYYNNIFCPLETKQAAIGSEKELGVLKMLTLKICLFVPFPPSTTESKPESCSRHSFLH